MKCRKWRKTMQKTEKKPCVFAVNDTYHIMVPAKEESLMWVRVGEHCYYDESNGILKSHSDVHRMIVPMEELNRVGQYILCERVVIERKPYFTQTEEVQEYVYDFYPVREQNARAYHISDAHNLVEEPILAARAYGEIDFLILNGDVINDSGALEHFQVIYDIAYALTKGEKPVVFARGNHDLRGIYAECLEDYTPTDCGKTYYTFQLGSIWGLILDCGEDKDDCHKEYGNTICCHAFRQRQTAFIRQVIAHAKDQYLSENVKTRLVIVHNPFTEQIGGPFDIEEALYREWAMLLKEHIKPDLMLCGHLHRIQISYPKDEHDCLGNPCPVVVGATINPAKKHYIGSGFVFGEKAIHVTFTSEQGEIVQEAKVEKLKINN